ncbi:MAG: hypothetical protein HYX69_15930 [Planctomycetia bacterium]|nr:hypothetical protein [Planctomycetia bacterium]
MHATALVITMLVAQIPQAQTKGPGAGTGHRPAAPGITPPAAPSGVGAATPGEDPARGRAAARAAEPPSQPAGPLVPVEPRPAKRKAADLLRTALVAPEGGQITGRSVTLVEALRASLDRATQLRTTESYWKLAAALADYNFNWDEAQQLERLKPASAPDQQPSTAEHVLATRMAAAQARQHDAELALVAAQYELAAAMRLPTTQPLPLPADVPHVGPYKTVLDQVFAGRVAPARAVLIDRTLPVRRGAIEARAAAVAAASDAVEAIEESYYGGQADLPLVLSLVDELAQQRRALVSDVRTYNNEIAEYALSVPVTAPTTEALVAMLIKPSTVPTGVVAGGGTGAAPGGAAQGAGSGVERAGFNQPVRTPPAAQTPPRAGAPAHVPPPSTNFPKGAPAASGEGAPAQPEAGTASPAAQGSAAPRHEAQKPSTADQDTAGGTAGSSSTSAAIQGLYQGLYDVTPAEQARHLTDVLFWSYDGGKRHVEPTALADYVSAIPAARRREAIVAYWQAHQSAARHAVMAQQLEQIDTLAAMLSDTAAPAADALIVRAARMAAEADAQASQADSLVAQWTLTVAAGRPAGGRWLAPTTPPHVGGYRLALNELPRELSGSAAIQRLASEIPKAQRAATEHAAAVVSADKNRATHAIQSSANPADAHAALVAVHEQTAETLSFLGRLADYNIDIAEYATLVLPPTTGAAQLAGALVTVPGAAAP